MKRPRSVFGILLLAGLLAGCSSNAGHVGRTGEYDSSYYRSSTEDPFSRYGDVEK